MDVYSCVIDCLSDELLAPGATVPRAATSYLSGLPGYLSALAFQPRRDTDPQRLLQNFAASCLQIPEVACVSFHRAPHEVRLRLRLQREANHFGESIETTSECLAAGRSWGTLTLHIHAPAPIVHKLAELLAQQLALSFHHQRLAQQREYLRGAVRACRADLAARKLLHRAIGIVARDFSLSHAQAEDTIHREAKETRRPLRIVVENIVARDGQRKAEPAPPLTAGAAL